MKKEGTDDMNMYGMYFSLWDIVKASLTAMVIVAVFYIIMRVLHKFFGNNDKDRDRRK
ncbi:MAG: hypothetical protein MRZ36_01500 [Eubacterium sp.]|nr:hypothetical protein [Eubacterium sp.]